MLFSYKNSKSAFSICILINRFFAIVRLVKRFHFAFDCFRFGDVIFPAVDRFWWTEKSGRWSANANGNRFFWCAYYRFIYSQCDCLFVAFVQKSSARILTLRFDSTKNERREIETAAYLIQPNHSSIYSHMMSGKPKPNRFRQTQTLHKKPI